MSAEINYKNKYMALRSKYMNDLDMAFRLGMEQGAMQEQQNQMAEQQAQEQAMQEAAAAGMGGGMGGEGGGPDFGGGGEQGGQPGQPGEAAPPGGAPEDAQGGAPQAPGGSELDQHISELEGLVAKSEDPELKKSLAKLKLFRKTELFNIEMKKSDVAVKGIVKALHKPKFKLGVQAKSNLSANAKQAVSLQHKIVNDVLAKMEVEEAAASKDIKSILSLEGLTKNAK